MKLNFSDVDTFGPLPDQMVYGAEIILSTLGMSKNDNQKWQVRLKITEAADGLAPVMQTIAGKDSVRIGDKDMEYSKAIGRQLFDDISLVEAAQFKVVEALQALGEDVKAGEDRNFEFDPPNYIGRNVGVIIENVEYGGRTSPQVKRYVGVRFVGYALDDPELSQAAAA